MIYYNIIIYTYILQECQTRGKRAVAHIKKKKKKTTVLVIDTVHDYSMNRPPRWMENKNKKPSSHTIRRIETFI